MKSILPILICSAITGGLGYYFGHITLPSDANTAAPAPVASTVIPTPQPAAPVYQPPVAPEPAPVVDEPEPATEVATEPAPAAPATESDFAERAAKPVQMLTDKQGRSIQASIVEVLDSEVKIRRSDGLVTTIPLNMLSEQDVAFCNYLREQAKTKEVQKPASTDGFDWDAYFNS